MTQPFYSKNCAHLDCRQPARWIVSDSYEYKTRKCLTFMPLCEAHAKRICATHRRGHRLSWEPARGEASEMPPMREC